VTSKELREAGLRVTSPRIKILEILENSAERHMSADAVYKASLEW
jgi:Fur family ferric uptake transcriptional regulator